MKKIVLLMLTVAGLMLFTTGCSDKAYDFAKDAYVAGKGVVQKNKDNISGETYDKLKKVDKAAVTYNKVRPVGKKVVEYIKERKEKK